MIFIGRNETGFINLVKAEEDVMRESEYVKSKIVQQFISWLLLRVNQPERFTHSYVITKRRMYLIPSHYATGNIIEEIEV